MYIQRVRFSGLRRVDSFSREQNAQSSERVFSVFAPFECKDLEVHSARLLASLRFIRSMGESSFRQWPGL